MPQSGTKRRLALRILRKDTSREPKTGVAAVPGHVLPHLKVAFAFLSWVSLIREQARGLVDWPFYGAQALVVAGALALSSLVAVYLYPPRTARWRTLVWTFIVSTVAGTLMNAAVGGRSGPLVAMGAGAAVLACRCDELGRRTVRALRSRRAAGRA